jgi:MFS transporter, Spinster family, sphingosine-1-phosphate transporter
LGWVADQNWFERRFLLFFCVVLWSLGTALAGLSNNLGELIFWRSLVGAGTGAFNVICPVMLADFFPIAERNLVYGIFALFIPVGAALGFGFGAFFAGLYGWRVAMYIVGFPGVVFAFSVYLCNDPSRGVNDTALDCLGVEKGQVEMTPAVIVGGTDKVSTCTHTMLGNSMTYYGRYE